MKGSKAKVRIEGKTRTVDASLLANLRKGDYILLHDNLAIQKLNPEDTKETLEIIKELGL